MAEQTTAFDQVFKDFFGSLDANDLSPANSDVVTIDNFDFDVDDPMIPTSNVKLEFPLPEIDLKEDKVKVEPIYEFFDIPSDHNEVVAQEQVDEDVPEKDDVNEECDDQEWSPTLADPDTTSRKRKANLKVQETVKDVAKPSNGKKKRKLYEQKPYADPTMERNRQNAINAKKNRERKKKEKEALQTQMDLLRAEVARLQAKVKAQERVLKKHGLKV